MNEHELPKAELDVMRCLWEGQPRTAREIREGLLTERPMSHSSVCTLLRRLEAKGFVAREKASSGKAFVYRAAVRPTRTRRRLVRDLVNRVFSGSGVDLIAAMFEGRPPSERQLNELQQLLDELRSRRQTRATPATSSAGR